jgi:2'-5' RNA ligase
MRLDMRHDLFFALLPDPDVAPLIGETARDLKFQFDLAGKVSERLHVSLIPVGSFASGLPDRIVTAALQAGAAVEIAPFEVTFDRYMSFKNCGPHPFVLVSSVTSYGLHVLRYNLGKAMKQAGLGADISASGFNPHITLLWDHKLLHRGWIDLPITWVVSEFALVHSYHGQGRHDYITTWPLQHRSKDRHAS